MPTGIRRSAGGQIPSGWNEFAMVYRNFQMLENVAQNLRVLNAISDVQLNTILSFGKKHIVAGNLGNTQTSTSTMPTNVVNIGTKTRRRARSRRTTPTAVAQQATGTTGRSR